MFIIMYLYDNFYQTTKTKDAKFFVEKIVEIPHGPSKNIISFSNCFVIFIDRLLLIIFLLLTFGQVNKYIISCFISKKVIKITKVISLHCDLTILSKIKMINKII